MFSYAYGAEVMVQDVGGVVTVTINAQIHVFDRYNWDPMKQTDLHLLGKVPDSTLGSLHQAGIAHEFEVVGHSNASHKEFRYDPSQKWILVPPPVTQPSR